MRASKLMFSILVLTLLASGAALMLSLIAPWLFAFVYKESYLAAVPYLRWFVWSMVPLTLANVLINNLMARSQFPGRRRLMMADRR